VTKPVTFPLRAERTAHGIVALADIPIAFSNWDIANPSLGGFVTTANSGILEVLVFLTPGAGNPATTTSGATPGGGGPPGQVTVPPTTVPPVTIPQG
jgi:hypothetical protein